MRCFYVFFLIICLLSCKAKSDIKSAVTKEVSNMECPKEGKCSLGIIENKILQINTDNLGSVYPEVLNGDECVLKFEYNKLGNSNYQDSGYREEIFIEIDKSNPEIKTEDLKNKKLFFARWCYCKGQTGYYKINKGKLSITKVDENSFRIQLNFKIEEVPQVINRIDYIFSLQ